MPHMGDERIEEFSNRLTSLDTPGARRGARARAPGRKRRVRSGPVRASLDPLPLRGVADRAAVARPRPRKRRRRGLASRILHRGRRRGRPPCETLQRAGVMRAGV